MSCSWGRDDFLESLNLPCRRVTSGVCEICSDVKGRILHPHSGTEFNRYLQLLCWFHLDKALALLVLTFAVEKFHFLIENMNEGAKPQCVPDCLFETTVLNDV